MEKLDAANASFERFWIVGIKSGFVCTEYARNVSEYLGPSGYQGIGLDTQVLQEPEADIRVGDGGLIRNTHSTHGASSAAPSPPHD
jgi:hypothetical protein